MCQHTFIMFSKAFCNIYVYQIVTMYTLNLHSVKYQLYLKAGEKKK